MAPPADSPPPRGRDTRPTPEREDYRKGYEAAKKEIEEAQAYREQDARRAAIVEMERKRLLKEYATKYKDFLPKGVIQNEEELREIFGV